MELSEETKELLLEAIRANDLSIDTLDKNDTGAGHASNSEAATKKIGGRKLEKGIEKLLIEVFRALIRKEDSEKSTLSLITKFTDESVALSPTFHESYKDLKQPFDEFWENFQLNLAASVYERHSEDTTETIGALARICAKLSRELLKRKDKSKTNPVKRPLPRKQLEQKTVLSRPNDFFNMGKDLASNKKPIHAILSFYMAAELYKVTTNGDDAIIGIDTCSYQICLVVEEMAEEEALRDLILDLVLPIIRNQIDFIRSIQNSTGAVRVKFETWSLCYIGACYGKCGEHRQLAKVSETAIELMETEFKEKADNYQVYAHCLNNAAAAYGTMGNIRRATELHKMSLEAYKCVTDWKSEGEAALSCIMHA